MNELSKNLKCVCLRNGVEIWVEEDRLKKIDFNTTSKFLDLDGELFNLADIVGIFSVKMMMDKTRRKNGNWQCQYGTWHDKKEYFCSCRSRKEEDMIKEIKEKIANCNECNDNGFIEGKDIVVRCECNRKSVEALNELREFHKEIGETNYY